MRNHAHPEKMAAIIERAGKSQSLGGLVENAQKRVEQRDYAASKQVLDFDDVMNMHRGIVYGLRNDVLWAEDTRKLIDDLVEEAAKHPPEADSVNLDSAEKPRRNSPCPCGSGKKYKQCCG